MDYKCPICDKRAKTPEDLRKIGCDCKTLPEKVYENNQEITDTINKAKKKEKEEDGRTPSKKLFDFAQTKIKKLVISENNTDEVYAVVNINNHVETINLVSSRAIYWLDYEYSNHVEANDVHGDDFYKTVLQSIRAKAQMNGTERTRIYNRIAQLPDSIWYDLGNEDWTAIKITSKGVETVQLDVDSPIFRRSQTLQKQVIPKSGKENALDDLIKLLHIVPKDKLLFKVHLVELFLEAFPIPMMVFDGSTGSAKTTVTATVKKIVDPSGNEKEDNVSAMAEKHDDLINQLYNRYLSSFDNVSKITNKESDIICRAITGSNNPKRKLYTDDEEVIHSFKRKIVLNGIVPTLEYPDLQTRLISYQREIIDETNRLTEQEFKEKLDELLPYALGQIFIILCKALRTYSDLKTTIQPKTRMSDFEVWGEIISRLMQYSDNEFLNSYYVKMDEGTISIQDAYPIVNAIQDFMTGKESYENTASNLYHNLVTIADNSGINLQSKYIRFPKSPNKLARDLVIVQPLLRSSGFIVEMYRYTKNDGRFTKNSSIIKITRKTIQNTLSEMPQVHPPSPPTKDSDTKSNKIGGDIGVDITNQIMVSPPEEGKFTYENISSGDSGDSGDGGDTPGNSAVMLQFFCKTHNAGPWPMNAVGSAGMNILEFHKNQGCEIEFIKEHEDANL